MPYSWPVTAAEVDAELNLGTDTSQDSELAGFVGAATEVVENITGPITSTAYSEWHDGGQPTILLRHYPVVSVESVTEYTPAVQVLAAEPTDTTTTFTGYGYTVDTETGLLTRTSAGRPYHFATGRVLVNYHAGRATVPPSVRLAALELVRHMWETQRGDGDGRAVPGYDGPEPGEAPSAGYLVPNRVLELLAPYRKAPKVA